jgi:hypothetical protein
VVHSSLRLFQRQAATHEEQNALQAVHIPGRIENAIHLRDSVHNAFAFELIELCGRDPQLVECMLSGKISQAIL